MYTDIDKTALNQIISAFKNGNLGVKNTTAPKPQKAQNTRKSAGKKKSSNTFNDETSISSIPKLAKRRQPVMGYVDESS
jgi:hypothetical protein